MKIKGKVEENFVMKLEFNTREDASTFQAMMKDIFTGKTILPERKEKIKTMSRIIYDKCLEDWK